MKARSKHSSCKDLKKKVSLQLEIDESLVDSKPSKNNLSGTLAQSIPRLPETKFFPSSCRNLNVSLNTKAFNTISANIKTTQIANNSAVNLHNFSLEQPMKKDHTVNYSQFSVKSEQNSSVSKWADLPLPASPLAVISAFPMKLTKYEYGEILKFPAVYFIGADSKKLITTENPSENFGFDDENGYYKPVLHDHIAYRYEVFEILGKGSFSQVFRVFDYKHQSFSALKIIKNKKRFYQQGLIEIDILKNLRKKDSTNNNNIIHIQSSFMFRNHIVI